MDFVLIANRGPDIDVAGTNFWDHELATKHGGFYLTANAGALRLLVPDRHLGTLMEMRDAKRVEIVRVLQDPRLFDVVFEDGTRDPWFVGLDPKVQLDRALTKARDVPFTVWSRTRKELDLICHIMVNVSPVTGVAKKG